MGIAAAGSIAGSGSSSSSSRSSSSDVSRLEEERPILPGVETAAARNRRLRDLSSFGHMTGWNTESIIAKSNDDLRQESFIMQIIQYFQLSFRRANVPVWIQCYKIQPCSKTSGLVQFLPNTISLDSLKKHTNYAGSLRLHFEKCFGGPDGETFKLAVSSFVKSLAAYSVITYLLAIKDRYRNNVNTVALG